MLGAVYMTSESTSFGGEFSYRRQREYLKPATVCQNRTVPGLEFMQSAGRLQNVQPWTQVQVICIAEYYLGADIFFKVTVIHAFYRTHGPDRHKNRGMNIPMVCMNDSTSRFRMRIRCNLFEFHSPNIAIISQKSFIFVSCRLLLVY